VEFFNEAMVKAAVVQPDHRPVVSSQLNPDKSFSFIEFSTIDEATAGKYPPPAHHRNPSLIA
jgi:hypothetical protein